MCSNLFAQKLIDNREALRTGMTKELNLKGINDFLFFIKTSPSPIIISNEFDVEGVEKYGYVNFEGYLFWKENSKIFIKKFDYNDRFDVKELKDFTGLEFALQNSDKIKSEIVLPYKISSKGENNTLVSPNEYQYDFYFHFGASEFEKKFTPNGLIKNDYSDPNLANINYSKNYNLKMIQLYKFCLIALEVFNEN